jgi:hypothetical protein
MQFSVNLNPNLDTLRASGGAYPELVCHVANDPIKHDPSVGLHAYQLHAHGCARFVVSLLNSHACMPANAHDIWVKETNMRCRPCTCLIILISVLIRCKLTCKSTFIYVLMCKS